jgi:hypothetical protein
MKPAILRIGRICRKLAPPLAALALAAVIGGASTTPARAQEFDGNRGHQMKRDHDNRHHYRQHDDDRYEYHSYERPAYVYVPPPVYYAPPPAPPVVDLVFPLRFR